MPHRRRERADELMREALDKIYFGLIRQTERIAAVLTSMRHAPTIEAFLEGCNTTGTSWSSTLLKLALMLEDDERVIELIQGAIEKVTV